ncbi:hypothetical protein OAY13_00630 [Candidatus Pelagibacter sp.]|nr:hypothetical protein [Candidatus Pelagibacter sp.]
MKKKLKLLIFVSNIYTTLIMLSHFLNSKNKYKTITVIIERRKSDGKIKFNDSYKYSNFIKKIFNIVGLKSIFFYEREKKYNIFSFKSLLNSSIINEENKNSQNKLKNFFLKNNLSYTYDEVWFTNDLTSKIYLNLFPNNKKIYFFHGMGDIMILKRKNFLERFFENFRFYLNKKIFHYYFVINQKNITFINFFSKYYNSNIFEIPKKINLSTYKYLIKLTSKKIIKKNINKKILLITDNINLQKFNENEAKLHSKYYVEKLLKYFKLRIRKNITEFTFCFKWKGSVPNFHKKIFVREFLKYGVKLHDVDKFYKDYISLEYVISNLKPDYITSNYSSINYIIKILSPTTKIISTKNIYKNFKKEYSEYHSKNNLSNLLKNSERIKSLVSKMPYDDIIKN